ncbi:MAG: Hsp20/alpha crystallin family protein [Novosphingobium sp.]
MSDQAAKQPQAAAVPVKQAESPQAGPFDWLRKEVDHLFEEFRDHQQRRLFDWPARIMPQMPNVDLEDKGDEFQLTAELPGFEIKDVSLELKDGSLLISATREEQKEEKQDNVLMRERHSGRVERRVPLPRAVDAAGAKAALNKGVLTVTLPKKPEPAPASQKIPIQA